jgi:hypothetical protein
VRSDTLAVFHNIGCAGDRPNSYEQMDVIGLNRKFQNSPSLIQALFLNQGLAVFSYISDQNRLAPLWGPNKMIDNQVNPVLVALVFVIHIYNIT